MRKIKTFGKQIEKGVQKQSYERDEKPKDREYWQCKIGARGGSGSMAISSVEIKVHRPNDNVHCLTRAQSAGGYASSVGGRAMGGLSRRAIHRALEAREARRRRPAARGRKTSKKVNRSDAPLHYTRAMAKPLRSRSIFVTYSSRRGREMSRRLRWASAGSCDAA